MIVIITMMIMMRAIYDDYGDEQDDNSYDVKK